MQAPNNNAAARRRVLCCDVRSRFYWTCGTYPWNMTCSNFSSQKRAVTGLAENTSPAKESPRYLGTSLGEARSWLPAILQQDILKGMLRRSIILWKSSGMQLFLSGSTGSTYFVFYASGFSLFMYLPRFSFCLNFFLYIVTNLL